MLLLRYLSRRPWSFFFEACAAFKGGFATDESEVGSLEEGVFVVNNPRHGR